jgi:hypothetical protein
MPNYCLECGGELVYDPKLKQYACRSCGLTFTAQQILEGKSKLIDESFVDDDYKKKKQKDYLKWWLSKK